MSDQLDLRRMRASGDANDLEPTDADDLIAPEITEAHTFVVGDIVRRTGLNSYVKAQSDTLANIGRGLALVVHIDGSAKYSVLRHGNVHAVTITGHGLVGGFGTDLYLSTAAAGELTVTRSPGQNVYVGFIIDANTIQWEPGWSVF